MRSSRAVFGNKKKLVQKLTETGGTVALADVVKAVREWQSTSSSFSGASSFTDHVKVTLQVQPEGEPPFEATFSQAFQGISPMAGWTCKVIYDPSDHDKIAVLDGEVFPPGVSPEQAERAGAMRAGMLEAMRNGNVAAYVQQVKDQAASGNLPGVVIAGGQVVSGAAAPKPDVVDQLTKLADLHKRGALTDEEFQTEKAKLIDSS